MSQNYKHLISLFILSLFFLFVTSCDSDTTPTNTEDIAPVDSIVALDSTPFTIFIKKTEISIQGTEETIEINLQTFGDSSLPIGEIDLLIRYDRRALTFQFADTGQFIKDCGWEYFSYRSDPQIGEIRITAIAETNLDPSIPDCFSTNPNEISNQLAILHFLVTNDRTYECAFAPVELYWQDCEDNVVSSQDGRVICISNNIYSYDHSLDSYKDNIADPSIMFPSYNGANDMCDDSANVIRSIKVINGGVDINCAEIIDARGDLNLNEIAYEIADAVLYANYFVYGESVFKVNIDGQIYASDINADDWTLTVSDLVYMIRVIVGDALPYPPSMFQNPPVVLGSYRLRNGVISVDTLNISAAHIVVEGNVVPTLLAQNMEMLYNFDSTNTNIIIYSLEHNKFNGDMIDIGRNKIVSLEMADNLGNQVTNDTTAVFTLSQNYPNPFTTTTTISFSVPKSQEIKLTIKQVLGESEIMYIKQCQAGSHEYTFDGRNFPAGDYVYTLEAELISDKLQRTMTLER